MSVRKSGKIIAGTPRTTGGVEIGDMGFAPLGIDESLNLRRYMNGQVISQTQFVSFTTKLKSAVALFPSLATTEENWQAEKALSKFGQVGKFVIDDTAQTIRLPAVVNAQGLLGLSGIGNLVNESLPNITGSLYNNQNTYQDIGMDGATASGAISVVTDSNQRMSSSNIPDYTSNILGWNFDASRSSSTYQNNAPVQQEAVQYPYYIQVATGVEETLPAIREYQVNNSDYFGKSMYSDIAPDNASWLASNGQYNAKTVYPDYYNWLLEQMNAGVDRFKGTVGYAWKSQTADVRFWTAIRNPSVGCTVYGGPGIPFAGNVTAINPDGTLNFYEVSTGVTYENLVYTESENINNEGTAFGNLKFANDYDFVINTTDQTFRLPLLNGEEDLPGNTFENITYNGHLSSYTAPKNGSYTIWGYGATTFLFLNNATSGERITTQGNTDSKSPGGCTIKVKKGDIVTAGYYNGTVTYFGFTPAVGNGTLYYYVGDTVQDASLINAGAVLGQLATKTNSVEAAAASMPSGRYIDLTLLASGSTYTAPANGWFAANGSNSSGFGYLSLYRQSDLLGNSMTTTTAGSVPTKASIPSKKGDVVILAYGNGMSVSNFRFIYSEGDQ